MKVNDIRNLDDKALTEELDATRKELMNLRFRSAAKQLTNTSEVAATRKNIARILTVIRERELQRG